MSSSIREVLFSEEEIRETVRRLADRISEDYRGKDVLMIGLLRGCFFFLADLIRELSRRGLDCESDFLQVLSYTERTESSGEIQLLKGETLDVSGRNVLLVEEIVDTGNTLAFAVEHIGSKKPRSLRTCVLLDKPARRRVPIEPDYRGAVIENHFVVGYGLDLNGKHRELPYIARVEVS